MKNIFSNFKKRCLPELLIFFGISKFLEFINIFENFKNPKKIRQEIRNFIINF